MTILFEDNHCIAVVKPAGVLVQGDESGDHSLMDDVKEYLKEKYNKPGAVFLGLVHRLDRPVSGIVLFAKTSKGASRLSEQFRNRTVKKTYLAAVEGVPRPAAGKVKHYVLKDRNTNTVEWYPHQVVDSKLAELYYKTLETKNGRSLVEVKPVTGRPHQIRVAMQSLGTPIVGDKKYGANSSFHGNIALFAQKLKFNTVVGGDPIELEAKPLSPLL